MKAFVDTSAFLAVLDRDDQAHEQASVIWTQLIEQHIELLTTNYVLVETNALIQQRLGMQILHIFEEQVVSILNTTWIDKEIHKAGLTTLRAANRRGLSLVDCVSFIVCQQLQVKAVFAFDNHFWEQGFKVLIAG